MTEIGTLSELGALPGDTVESIDSISFGRVTLGDPAGTGFSYVNTETESLGTVTRWRMISRRPRTWGEMTDAEKGALLLAWSEGKQIEWAHEGSKVWRATCLSPRKWDKDAFRIKPEPVVETVTLHGARGVSFTEGGETHFDTHRITFTTTDGEPATGTFTNENGDVMTMERIDAG